MKPTFIRDVEDHTVPCSRHEWFDDVFFTRMWNLRPWSFDWCLRQIQEFLQDNIVNCNCSAYKIGICENPRARWQLYRRDKNYRWQVMYLLYAAPTSKPWIAESTGTMETKLIEYFNSDTDIACINRPGAGGECPSNGSPHCVYVVVS